MRKYNILVVHNYYLTPGGEDVVFENEVNLLKEKGHNVFVYSVSNCKIFKSFISKLMLPLNYLFNFSTYKEIIKIVQDKNIEIIHCHNIFPLVSPSVYYAAHKCKIPVIQTVHNFRLICPNALLFKNGNVCIQCIIKKSFLPAIVNRCYHESLMQTILVVFGIKFHKLTGIYNNVNFIFLTKLNYTIFKSSFCIDEKRVFIKPNFTNFHNIDRDLIDEKNFVYVGRLVEEKGIVELLNLWSDLPDCFKLKIIGTGEMESTINDYLMKHTNVTYLGYLNTNSIKQILSRSYCLIFPSKLIETFGMTIIEAFSVGCPVLALDVGNGAELVKKSNGGCVYNNSESFINGINDIVKNNEMYSNNALKYFCKNYEKEHNYKLLISIYEQIFNNKD